jgi:1-acyl-sn-glycerol-3-phosphate acyltransferase
MSDFSYGVIKMIGSAIVWITSTPVVLHRERSERPGPYILAANHLCPYDVAGLIYETPRNLDFLSIVEMLKNPLVGNFFKAMNCTFVDRGKADQAAAQGLASRLRQGRSVAMFPEGGIRTEANSVINGGPFKPGCVRLAQLTGVPIIPAVILGTTEYYKFKSWYPLRAVRWGLIYGNAIEVASGDDPKAEAKAATEKLRLAYLELNQELKTAIDQVKLGSKAD